MLMPAFLTTMFTYHGRSQFPVTRVALLSEMVEECLRLDVLFIIDIKCYDIRVRAL